MSWWHWPVDDEARERLAQIEERAPEVARLAEELREIQRRNHFSEMVLDAISRCGGGVPHD